MILQKNLGLSKQIFKFFLCLLSFPFLFSCKMNSDKKEFFAAKTVEQEKPFQEVPLIDLFTKDSNSNVYVGPEMVSGTLETMKELGYQYNEEGVCYGIAAMAIQAALRKDVRSFVNRLLEIRKGDFRDLLAKKREESPFSQEEKRRLHDLSAFFDGVKIYFGDSKIEEYAVQNWRKTMRLFQDESGQKFYTRGGVGRYTEEDFRKLIHSVIQEEKPVGFFMIKPAHATALIKGGPGKALFVDHDQLQLIEADHDGALLLLERMGSLLSVEQVSQDRIKTPRGSQKKSLYSKVRKQLKEEDLLIALRLSSSDNLLNDLRYLVEKRGVDPESILPTKYKDTPLMFSSQKEAMESVQYLVENALVDVDRKRAHDGATAIMMAAWNGSFDIVHYLHEVGKADLSILDDDAYDVVNYAIRGGA